MALTSEATTLWFGDLQSGSGTTSLDSSDAAEFPVSWQARSVGEVGKTNPEELLGAAHSACFSMAFSNVLAENGTPPESLQVTAAVTFVPGEGIKGSHLLVSAKVAGISEEDFQKLAADAKANCPVSQALAGIPITLEASLA
ncbi:MAG: lipoyl-dependent peroxiredoxin [Actinomycetota bacterium]|jgi:osmotically inducible protein OsmC|nr:OsmC family peroxiredoxin [Glaciihabitans sp.]MDQ1529704.1 lipoyl-dependent peroxiredoxin [Actinomycetota bacterium]MDQ1543390.1 lipoyl-dependent peroxiredoxin [Actinomycetota bacterium]MDQ1562660.1 lipoyl-dependent peroxiredoxin [Actinomycetota bacterium]MDQ1563788.1 lipoyl-dependent peroxiredoxin [Actinomycetota bacterium]